MQKAYWTDEGENIRLHMPISKVDVENRTVSGWASLDNIDRVRDLVDAAASKAAFETFRGNIREMHDPKKAAGRLVSFREDTYFDPEDQKFYQGIYVTAYVSKGAQDTWEKVLDGTLSGFSIGGAVEEYVNDIDENGNPFRRIVKYMLTELSLVDSPCNQFANVISFAKADGENVLTGDLAEITVRNVYVCNKCLGGGHGVHLSSEDSVACPACNTDMVNIGIVESSDPEPKETVKKVLDAYLANTEGGVAEDMADNETVEEVTETEVTETQDETPQEEATVEETVEESTEAGEEEETADEAQADTVDPLTEAIGVLHDLADRLETNRVTQEAQQAELRKSFEELDARFNERLDTLSKSLSDLEQRQTEFDKKFEGIDESFVEVRKGLTDVGETVAFKKSVDSDQSTEGSPRDKSFWAGSFLNIESL